MTKQILSIPKKGAKGLGSALKQGAKAAMQPATPAATWHFVLGAVLSAPVSTIYGLLFSRTIGRLGLPQAIRLGVRVLLPLVPMYFVKTSQIPFGNIINGGLAGIMIAQGIAVVRALSRGRVPFLMQKTLGMKPTAAQQKTTAIAADKPTFFDKLM